MSNYVTSLHDLQLVKQRNHISALLNRIRADTIVEIGVRDGKNLLNLLSCNYIQQAYAVDIWKDTGIIAQNDERSSQKILDEQYNTVIELSQKDPRIHIIKDFSTNAAKLFPDEYFDFVYIDADHTEQAVTDDINSWWSKIRYGGILSGHDYSPAIVNYGDYILTFGVIQAVNKFVNENKLQLHIDIDGDWFIPKL